MGNWLYENIKSYLHEAVDNDYPIEEMTEDIIDIIKEAKDNGCLFSAIHN